MAASSSSRGSGYPRGRGRGPPPPGRGPPPPPSANRSHARNANPAPPPPLPLLTQEELDNLPPVDWDALRKQAADEKEKNPPPLPCTDAEQRVFVQLLSLGHDSEGAALERRFQKTLEDHWEDMGVSGQQYHSAMALAFRCPDFKTGKVKSMTGNILVHFERWVGHRAPTLRHFVDSQPQFRTSVFAAFLKQDNATLRAKAFRLCCLHDHAKDFKGHVDGLVKEGDFKRACEVAAALDLHAVYSLREFVIPLIVEDKADVADDFLSGSRSHQVEVIRFLDSLIVDNTRKVSDLHKRHPGKHAKGLRLAPKPLGKFIDKWMDRFKVGAEHAPNHCSNRKHGAFRYLVGQKDEPSMRLENWRDLVMQYVKDDEELRAKLLQYLLADSDVTEAVYWAKTLRMPEARLPYAVMHEMGVLPDKEEQQEEENWDGDGASWAAGNMAGAGGDAGAVPPPSQDWAPEQLLSSAMAVASLVAPGGETQYYRMPLGRDSIFFVDTREAFLKFVEDIQAEPLTGLDAEYRPKSLTPTQESVAILQVACPDKVYLIDVVTLSTTLSDADWRQFVLKYFVNKAIVILGFGLRGDFQVMAKTLEAFADLENRSEGVLDLEMFEKRLTGVTSGGLIQKPFQSDRKGLAGLVESVLGYPLDKRDQMSDWDKRPLSDNQVTYAALDAYVLLDVYSALKDVCVEANYEKCFCSVAEEQMQSKNKVPKVKRQSREAREKQRRLALEESIKLPPEEFKPFYADPISPQELRVVCDNMLQGLCKKLRLHGVDATAIESFEPFENCGVVARRDDSMVLTAGSAHYIKLRQMVAKGRCLRLETTKPEEQVEEVFRYFNVAMTDADFFTRCVLCNSNAYIVIPRESLVAIKEKMMFGSAAALGGGRQKSQRCVPDFDDYDERGDEQDRFYDYEDLVEEKEEAAVSVWMSFDGGDVHCLTGCTREGVELKLGEVPDGVARQQTEFFACAKCGKMFWRGSHWDKVLKKGSQE